MGTMVIPATEVKTGMIIPVLTLGEREVVQVTQTEETVTVVLRNKDELHAIEYPIGSDIEVLVSIDGF